MKPEIKEALKREFKDGFIYIVQNLIYLLFLSIPTLVIFAFSMVFQIFDDSVLNVIGEIPWKIIYLGLPVAVVIIPLFVKYFKKLNFKKTYAFAGISVLVYALIAFGFYGGVHKYLESFTPHKWAEHRDERYFMLENLNSKYTLIGMSREELTELLGKSEGCYASPLNDNELIEYRIGYFSIDPTQLSFELEDGKVIDVYVYTEFRTARKPIDTFF